MGSNDLYRVEKVFGFRTEDFGRGCILIKWHGFGVWRASWEPFGVLCKYGQSLLKSGQLELLNTMLAADLRSKDIVGVTKIIIGPGRRTQYEVLWSDGQTTVTTATGLKFKANWMRHRVSYGRRGFRVALKKSSNRNKYTGHALLLAL